MIEQDLTSADVSRHFFKKQVVPAVWPRALVGARWLGSAALTSAQLHGSVLERHLMAHAWSVLRGRVVALKTTGKS